MNKPDDILICTICNNRFNDTNRLPRMISDCGHTFCEECLYYKVINTNHTFTCPEDGEMITCKRDSINNFPKNISIIKIMKHQQITPKQQQHALPQKETTQIIQNKPYSSAYVEVSQKSFPSTQSFSDNHNNNHNINIHVYETPSSITNLNQQLQTPTPNQTIKTPNHTNNHPFIITNNNNHLNKTYSQQPSQQQLSSMKSLTLCSIHNKLQDLGCIQCQLKVCSHCAIFGTHKDHTLIPEDEMKKRNKNGLNEMIEIKNKIQHTREDFVNKMENNFKYIICNQIHDQKNSFKQATKLKFQEFLKLLEYSEQKCYDEIERFYEQVEEKFRKFKNHDFKETYDKIVNWNKMIEQTKIETENLEKQNQVNFDLFLHLDKLLVCGNELEIEYNNLIQFPVKLISKYLENISFSFSDSIKTNIENCMSIQFLDDESHIIHQSMHHLTLDNQKEILSNSQFFSLTPVQINQILGTTSVTPTSQFLQQHEISNISQQKNNFNQMQLQKSSLSQQQLNNRKNSLSQQQQLLSSRQNSSGSSKIRNRVNEIQQQQQQLQEKREISLQNVQGVVQELSEYRQQNIIPKLRESSLNKDKLLLSNIDSQQTLMKNCQSLYNSVIINNNVESDRQHQIYPFSIDTVNSTINQSNTTTSNPMLLIQELPYSPSIIQNQYSDIKFNDVDYSKDNNNNNVNVSNSVNKSKQTFSTHENCKFQANLEKQISELRQSKLLNKSNQNQNSNRSHLSNSQLNNSNNNLNKNKTRKSNNNSNISNNDKQQQYYNTSREVIQTPKQYSRSRSPYIINDIDTSNNNNNNNNNYYEIKSARSHYTNNNDNNDNNSIKYNYLKQKKSITPDRNSYDKQYMSKSLINTNLYQNQSNNINHTDLSKTLFSNEDVSSTSSMNGSTINSNNRKIITSSAKNQSLKFFKSPTKTNTTKSSNNDKQQQQISPISSRKQPSILNYKKKSDKLQVILSKLKLNQYIDHIELVSEDLIDEECEELGNEIGKTRQCIDSIKLVKNRISDIGLKYILQGLQKSEQNIHTLNLTSNLCSENCFDDILYYLQKNQSLKNIYLLNNNIQIYKNKDKLKNIQQLCNIHI